MSEAIIAWGHNPGQWAIKDTLDGINGKTQTTQPYPAVIAPWAKTDELGLSKGTKSLEATVNGNRYLGGVPAQYSPLAMRQMATGRLDENSPIYPAFAQMSYQHTSLHKRVNGTLPSVAIATALPIGWKDENAERAIEQHIRTGLKGLANIKHVYVKSEPAAVILHEMLTDEGTIRQEQATLAKGLVCVADIGGSTLNRSVLNGMQLVPGQSDSPYLGSFNAIQELMQKAGLHQAADAEQRLLAEIKTPGSDALARSILRTYRDAVVANLQQAWKSLNPVGYLIAGGTAFWVGKDIQRAFGVKVRITSKPQQTIATGLYRFVKFELARSAKK